MPPCQRLYVGAAAIVTRDVVDGASAAPVRQLLMVQRAGTDGDGTWSLPGGWINWDEGDPLPEDAFATATRETREETGVWVEPYADGGSTIHGIREPSPHAGKAALTVFVVCKVVHGEAQVREPEKCPAVEWVPLDGVTDRPLFEPLAMWWATNGRHLYL